MLGVDTEISRDVFRRDRDGDGIDNFFVAGADKGMDCPAECRFELRRGHQKIVIKDVQGNVGDAGVRRLYSARPRQVYRAALWVKVNGTADLRARLTIAAYEEGGRRPLQFECDASVGDTEGEFTKLVIGRDSDEPKGASGCVLPRRTRTIWFKFRANAGSDSASGTVTIDRVWFTRCPDETDGGCDASNDSPG